MIKFKYKIIGFLFSHIIGLIQQNTIVLNIGHLFLTVIDAEKTKNKVSVIL